MDSDTNLGSLLRKSLAVATKLQLADWIAWCTSVCLYPGFTSTRHSLFECEAS